MGACCYGDFTCLVTSEYACENDYFGDYAGDGTRCDEIDCDPFIACCLPDNSCQELYLSECNKSGGTLQSSLTTCADVDCTEPRQSTSPPREQKSESLMGELLDIPDGRDVSRDDISYDGNNQLLRNDGNGVFTDVSVDPLGYTEHTRCSSWVDFDNDMDLDLLLVNAFSDPMLLRNDGVDGNGNPVFVDVATEPFLLGVSNAMSASWADYDTDGDMDVVMCISQYPNTESGRLLIRNDLKNGYHWLEVECIGTVSNRSAIGARLTVTAGGVQQIREIESGSGYFAAHMLTAHFGLGPNEIIDSLHIRFPNGREVAMINVPADQKITVVEPCDISLGECDDCDLNGVSDTQDIAAGSAADFNFNNVLDSCDIATGTSLDCNLNGIPDECELADPNNDCNTNGIPDSCEPREPLIDCNANGTSDQCDIASGISVDTNENGIPDECEISACNADFNDNGTVDIDDFSIFLVEWGCMNECSADINTDGVVDLADFSWFLILFNATCEEEPLRNAPQRSENNGRSRPSRMIR
jgi:hypothetical protein